MANKTSKPKRSKYVNPHMGLLRPSKDPITSGAKGGRAARLAKSQRDMKVTLVKAPWEK